MVIYNNLFKNKSGMTPDHIDNHQILMEKTGV